MIRDRASIGVMGSFLLSSSRQKAGTPNLLRIVHEWDQ